ncbi:hypothetical protein SDJN02_04581, partial [Cucurbita argyrosperma subsp. argyrosperma]
MDVMSYWSPRIEDAIIYDETLLSHSEFGCIQVQCKPCIGLNAQFYGYLRDSDKEKGNAKSSGLANMMPIKYSQPYACDISSYPKLILLNEYDLLNCTESNTKENKIVAIYTIDEEIVFEPFKVLE